MDKRGGPVWVYADYNIEEVEGGVRSRVSNAALGEETAILPLATPLDWQRRASCSTLILRAVQGRVAETVVWSNKDSALVEVARSNSCSILAKPHQGRVEAIKAFLGL
jgi:hypothetical protein